LHRQQTVSLPEEAGVTPLHGCLLPVAKRCWVPIPKTHTNTLLAKEPLRPVLGTLHHPCNPQPHSPRQLLLFKHGVFLGLLWTGLRRPAKHLTMCVGQVDLSLALAVPLWPWQGTCAGQQSFPAIPSPTAGHPLSQLQTPHSGLRLRGHKLLATCSIWWYEGLTSVDLRTIPVQQSSVPRLPP